MRSAKKAFNKLQHKNMQKEDKHIYPFNLAHFFPLQSYFLGCHYQHQRGTVFVIRGIKTIIGLIKGICILMRPSVMMPLHGEMLSYCVLTRVTTRPPGWIVPPSETHYTVSMIQRISKTARPMTLEGNCFCFVKAVPIYQLFKRSPPNHNIFKF